MTKILFTDSQVKKLSKNKWIKSITNKGITYTDEFKYKLVKECENYKENHIVFIKKFKVPFDNNLSERTLRILKTKTRKEVLMYLKY